MKGIPERVRGLAGTVADEVHRRLGPDVRVIWFGSWVQGGARPHSDLDIAIDAPGGMAMRDYATLWDWVDDLPALYSIDLVKLDEVSEEFRQRILKQGVVL